MSKLANAEHSKDEVEGNVSLRPNYRTILGVGVVIIAALGIGYSFNSGDEAPNQPVPAVLDEDNNVASSSSAQVVIQACRVGDELHQEMAEGINVFSLAYYEQQKSTPHPVSAGDDFRIDLEVAGAQYRALLENDFPDEDIALETNLAGLASLTAETADSLERLDRMASVQLDSPLSITPQNSLSEGDTMANILVGITKGFQHSFQDLYSDNCPIG